MKARNVIRTHQPLQGLAAFAPLFAAVAMHAVLPAGCGLHRGEGPCNPGEGSA